MFFVYLTLILIQLNYSFAVYRCPCSFGLFPDPLRCTNYYECEGFTPTSKQCGDSLFFNPKTKICDWPDNVDKSRCSNAVVNQNTNYIQNSNPISFRCHANGLYEDPVSCNHFVECAAGVPFRKICPANLVFDIRIKACNWPESMECEKHTKPYITEYPRPIPTNRPVVVPVPSNEPIGNPDYTRRPNVTPDYSRRPYVTPDFTEPSTYATPPHDPERNNLNFNKPVRSTTAKPMNNNNDCEWCFKCPTMKNEYFNNQYDKTTYYHCFDGQPYLLYCPRDSIWFQDKQTCESEKSINKEDDKLNESLKDNEESSFDGSGLIDSRMKSRKNNKSTPKPSNSSVNGRSNSRYSTTKPARN